MLHRKQSGSLLEHKHNPKRRQCIRKVEAVTPKVQMKTVGTKTNNDAINEKLKRAQVTGALDGGLTVVAGYQSPHTRVGRGPSACRRARCAGERR